MSTSSARNPGIDLLRGISILLVFFNHIGIRAGAKSLTCLAEDDNLFIYEAFLGFLIC